jgi:hypothetical protein
MPTILPEAIVVPFAAGAFLGGWSIIARIAINCKGKDDQMRNSLILY